MPTDSHYLHGHHESVLRSHAWRTVENSAGYLIPYLVPGASVLDVGCGPGTITVDFAERVVPGRVVGVDHAEVVVARAQADARAAGVTVEFRVGDIYALDFPDDSFDIVHAHQVLQHLSDPVSALRELRRVTKSGGVVGVRDVDYGGVRWYPANPGLDAWLSLYRRVARSTGGEPDAGPQLLSWAHAAGFTEVSTTASIWCFASESEREWWGGSWADRALHSGFAEEAVESGLAAASDLEEISRAWGRWTHEPDGVLNMPHNEIIARK